MRRRKRLSFKRTGAIPGELEMRGLTSCLHIQILFMTTGAIFAPEFQACNFFEGLDLFNDLMYFIYATLKITLTTGARNGGKFKTFAFTQKYLTLVEPVCSIDLLS